MDIFSLVNHFSFLSPSVWETARHRLKYCLRRPLSSKQPTNQRTKQHACDRAIAIKYKNDFISVIHFILLCAGVSKHVQFGHGQKHVLRKQLLSSWFSQPHTNCCLDINPIMVYNFASVFKSCIRVNDGLNIKLVDLFKLVGTGLSLDFCLVIRGLNWWFSFLLFSSISVVFFHTLGFSR